MDTGLYDPGLPGPLPLDIFLLLFDPCHLGEPVVGGTFWNELALLVLTDVAENVRIRLDDPDPDLKDLTGDVIRLDVP